MNTKEAIEKYKIITIVRNAKTCNLVKAVEVMYEAGLRLFEVTLNQKNQETIKGSVEQIRLLDKKFGNRIFLGVGTVMKKEQVNMVYDAGAKYVISPNTCEEVIRQTRKLDLVSMPGAMTPTEIAFAYDCGAHFVKVFPAGTLGEKYIKDLKGPLGYIPLIAVGGVTPENMKSFFKAGVKGVGIGSSLANEKLINSENWDQLKERALKFLNEVEYENY